MSSRFWQRQQDKRRAIREWNAYKRKWERKYSSVAQYGITGLTYKQWDKKTLEVSRTLGGSRTKESVQKSPFYRWASNPAFARDDKIRERYKRSFTRRLDSAKESYELHQKTYKKFRRVIKTRNPLNWYDVPKSRAPRPTIHEQNFLNYYRWRYIRHQGAFSKLGPAGFFNENTVVNIRLDKDIATFAQIIYPAITNDTKAIIKLQDDIMSKVIFPTVRQGVILIMKYVPMMTGKLRETMLEALRNYKKFQYPDIYEAEIFIHTIGLLYSKPVNNMPTRNLQHPNMNDEGFRSHNGVLYYLNDPEAVTEWFQKVIDELRIYAKDRWQDFEAFLLRALSNFRLLKTDEAMFNPNITERGYESGPDMSNMSANIREIMSDIFPRTRSMDIIMNKYELVKSMSQSVLPRMQAFPQGYNRPQQNYIDNLVLETIYGNPRNLATKQFIGLFIKTKFYGGTYR